MCVCVGGRCFCAVSARTNGHRVIHPAADCICIMALARGAISTNPPSRPGEAAEVNSRPLSVGSSWQTLILRSYDTAAQRFNTAGSSGLSVCSLNAAGVNTSPRLSPTVSWDWLCFQYSKSEKKSHISDFKTTHGLIVTGGVVSAIRAAGSCC